MLEFAAQYWLQVVFGGVVSVLSLLMKYLWGTIKREHAEQRLKAEGITTITL